MPYSELIKNFANIRGYMRQFLVYGFRSREEFDAKSARSYDNEKRRVESWLADYMSFRQDPGGKSVFLSMDSRHIAHNPLHKAWKASSFTKNDISLHFLLLDILADGKPLNISEILASIDRDYLPAFPNAATIDESTLRKKLKEYTELGLIHAKKQGKQLRYQLPCQGPSLAHWQDAIAFFTEDNPLGIIGSFLMDKFADHPSYFSFKHRYLLFALDSGIMLDLLTAIHEKRQVEMDLTSDRNGKTKRCAALPLKIYTSVQSGRQYLGAYNIRKRKACFLRLDRILKVKFLEPIANYSSYQDSFKQEQAHIWGVSTAQSNTVHLEMTLHVGPKDTHIIQRLEREKRCGSVTQLDGSTWRFQADVYDARELLPWLRTFIGRIVSLACSDKKVEERFWADLSALTDVYGGGSHAVS